MLYKSYSQPTNVNQTTLKILALFRTNYETTLYLREIAREIQVDVKAVSLQLSRLEKMNILTSTQRGRNKEYSLNLSNYSTFYYLVLAESLVTIEYLERNFEVKKLVSEANGSLERTALLFGSYAEENMTPESDIDIFIIDDSKPDLGSLMEVGSLLSREINVKHASENQFLNGLASNDPLTAEVVANHITLKGIDNMCDVLWRNYAKQPETLRVVP